MKCFNIQEKLKNAQLGHTQEIALNNIDEPKASTVSTENLLLKVNNSASVDSNTTEDGDLHEGTPNLGAHQVLSMRPRANFLASG